MGKKSVAVLTSGGDSPGMNACVRAVTRSALYKGWNVFGVKEGFKGLIDNDIIQLNSHSVSNIIQRGGTFLLSARSKRFFKEEYRRIAIENLKSRGIDCLVVIGGDGSFKGALKISEESDINVIGIPGTIDNDLFGTDATIGYDTALNTVVEAVDKIRDTASSHNRLFFIEVMGRDAGFIALRSGIATGAEAVLVPEEPTLFESLYSKLKLDRAHNKNSGVVIVAEGDDGGGALDVAEKVKQKFPDFDIRVTVLGHLQRGGAPSVYDRVLASRMGAAAIEGLSNGVNDSMVGIIKNEVVYTPLQKSVKHHKSIKKELLDLAKILSI